MGRTKLSFGKLDIGPIFLKWLRSAILCWSGGFQRVPLAQQVQRQTFSHSSPEKTRSTHSSRQRRITTKKRARCPRCGLKAIARRLTNPKTPRTALNFVQRIQNAPLVKNRMDLLFLVHRRESGRAYTPRNKG